jgi:hypothetical protein
VNRKSTPFISFLIFSNPTTFIFSLALHLFRKPTSFLANVCTPKHMNRCPKQIPCLAADPKQQKIKLKNGYNASTQQPMPVPPPSSVLAKHTHQPRHPSFAACNTRRRLRTLILTLTPAFHAHSLRMRVICVWARGWRQRHGCVGRSGDSAPGVANCGAVIWCC